MINNYYAGPHCKKIEHQLAEIKDEVRALKENQTSTGEKGLSAKLKQQFAEIKQEIRALQRKSNWRCAGRKWFPSRNETTAGGN